MPARLLVIILIVFCRPLVAGQINHSGVDYQAGVYSVTFDVEINASIDTVRMIVTDYEQLHQLSDILTESTVLKPADSGPGQRLIVINACILFYCREMKLVENIEEVDRHLVVSRTIPQQSDFKSGEIRWRLTELEKSRTRIEFFGKQEPDFWLPPLIGPVLVKRLLHEEALKVISNIESISENGRFHAAGS